MKLTPSSTTRRSVAMACSRLGGSPQIPDPVIRIAPKPMRLTVRSPPTSMVPAAAAVGCALTPYLLKAVPDKTKPDKPEPINPTTLSKPLMISPRASVAGGDHGTAQRYTGACRMSRGLLTTTWRTPVCTIRFGLKFRGRAGGEAGPQPGSCLRTVTVLNVTASGCRPATHSSPIAYFPGLVLPVTRISRFPAPGTTTGRYNRCEKITRESLPAEHFVVTANSPPPR